MPNDLPSGSLAFPLIPLGENETAPDFNRLLYEGGAALRVDEAEQAIQQGLLGDIISERIELVKKSHEFIDGLLAGGGSPITARKQILEVVRFFNWAEKSQCTLSISEVEKNYLEWAEHLWHRANVINDLSESSAYNYARLCGQVLDGALDRVTPLIELTRLKRPTDGKSPQGVKADKQVLEGTFAFGHLLQAICDGLTLDVIWGPRPVYVSLQDGRKIEVCATGARPGHAGQRKPFNVRASVLAAHAHENDLSLDNHIRRNLANLRIQSELMMFIGQTSMNLTDAQKSRLHSYSYSSDIDGYKVRDYKRRRHGEVLFEIFSEYRSHFERYLEWRGRLFPTSEQRLFPIIRRRGTREDRRPAFGSIQEACKNAGVPWVPPSVLRGTRVNWLLRRSRDADLTAEMAQHHRQTLLRVYEKPSLQVAINEIIRFHRDNDPALADQRSSLAAAPGECNGVPAPSAEKPEAAPAPNCVLPSGCLWCEHHRDIDSLDYVWSMACFRHLKSIELSRHCQSAKERSTVHPAELVMKRLSEKLSWFRDSNSTRRAMVEESLARVEEGNYHDQWSHLIEAMEGQSA